MTLILGIETSCDETAAAVFDSTEPRMLSNVLASQAERHSEYGGVVPEIASRSHLEKIDGIVRLALSDAGVSFKEIDVIGVTNRPGLVGSLLVGLCFAKGMAWAGGKKLIAVDHLEGHAFSAFLNEQASVRKDLAFPFLCMSVSGGHTALYLIEDFGVFKELGHTLDDAAGEALDKIARMIGYGYPGGPQIEKLALEVDNKDFFTYPRGKAKKTLDFSFSGLKTAVLYDLAKRGAYDLEARTRTAALTHELECQVASSLQVCIADIFVNRLTYALSCYPQVKAFAFVGGVSANKYITSRLQEVCDRASISFASPPLQYCSDNAAMIAYVASYKANQEKWASLTVDVFDKA